MTARSGTASGMLAGVHEVTLSHPDKVLFDPDVTKADLAAYYERVAPALLPHLRDRPLSLQVFPGGVGRPGHFMKNVPAYFPSWIDRIELPKRGGTVTHVLARGADTLRMLAQHNAVTLHVPTARVDRFDRPDRLVIDFDPSGGDEDFPGVKRGARLAADLMRGAGLEPFAMATGSRGVHVVAPIRRECAYADVLDLGRAVAAAVVDADPGGFTTRFLKEDRERRIFVDVLRNRPAQTVVAPYSVRARPGAPVAAPLTWEELDAAENARGWTLETMPERLERHGDPWAGNGAAAASPRSAARRLAQSTAG
jgi:bifunctional non-homologous end joining protein LigD